MSSDNVSDALVSMIVPIYNGSSFVESFYNQFVNQTYKKIELIIVNDGSTDNTTDALNKYFGDMPNVKLINKPNGGPSSARNRGLDEATGKYVVFTDVDDVIEPDYVDYLFNLVNDNDADMSVCGYMKMNENEKLSDFAVPEEKIYVYNQEEALVDFGYRKTIIGYSYLKLIKYDIVKDIRFCEDIYFGEDYIFTYEILKKCHRVASGTRCLYSYIQCNSSSTHVKKDNTLKYRKAWYKHLEVLNDSKERFKSAYIGILGKCYLLAVNDTTRISDKKKYKDFYIELLAFIKEHAKEVFADKSAGKVTRILGFAGMISPRLTCTMCKLFFGLLDRTGKSFRHTM
ncbi:MAG: glycosyltransferase [Clostridia bacterium]|nr:glycosyltransferase [Clostridia bacterium]